jgi:sec-independent protein translocase protein TatB
VFDLDPVKLLLIAVVALIVLGPDKLPTAARKASSLLGDLQRMRASLHDEVQSTVKDLPFMGELHDLQAAARRVGDPRHVISRAVTGALVGPRPGSEADQTPGSADPASVTRQPTGAVDLPPDFDPSAN